MRARLSILALAGALTIGAAGALAQVEAERRLDAAIERLRAALGPDMRLEIGGRRVDPVSGRATLIEVAIFEGQSRLTIPEVRLAELAESRIGRAELLRARYTGPDGAEGEMARMQLAGLAIPPPGAALDLAALAFEALEVEAVRVDDPANGAVRLARLEARGFTPQGLEAGLLEGFEFRDDVPSGQLLRLGRVTLERIVLPVSAGDFDPLAFRAGRIGLEGLELREEVSEVAMGVDRLALQDWVPGRPLTLAAEGLRVEAPGGGLGQIALRLARIEVAGVDAPRTLEAVLGGVQVPDPLPGTPQRLLFEALEAAWDGQPVVSLGRLLSEGGLENGVLSGALLAEGFRVIPPQGQAEWLEQLGYREIAGSLEMRGTMARAGGQLAVAPFRLSWEQAASLTVTADVANMPATPAEGMPVDPDATVLGLMDAQLGGLTLSLRDHGLLGRVLGQQAREQRVPEARLREQWAEMVLALPLPGEAPPRTAPGRRGAPPAPMPKEASAMAEARQAIAAFIRQPGTLELALRPGKPVPFGQIGALGAGGPGEAAQLLGLSVTAR